MVNVKHNKFLGYARRLIINPRGFRNETIASYCSSGSAAKERASMLAERINVWLEAGLD